MQPSGTTNSHAAWLAVPEEVQQAVLQRKNEVLEVSSDRLKKITGNHTLALYPWPSKEQSTRSFDQLPKERIRLELENHLNEKLLNEEFEYY